MWQDFDLDEFVRAVDAAIGPQAAIDRDRVYLVGHSGGGCNLDGGLLRAAGSSRIVARAVLAIDTCIDEEDGTAYGNVPESMQVIVRWQPEYGRARSRSSAQRSTGPPRSRGTATW